MLYGYLGASFLQNSCFIGLEEVVFRLAQGGDPFLPGKYGSAVSLLCINITDNWQKQISLIESLLFKSIEFRNNFDKLIYKKENDNYSQGYRYSIDIPCWSSSGYSTKIDDYEKLCQDAVSVISKTEHPSIYRLLDLIALKRREIAITNNTDNAFLFGRKSESIHILKENEN